METNKIVMWATGVILGVILIGSLLIPAVEATDYNRTTYTNRMVLGDVYRISDTNVDLDLEIYEGGVRGTIDGQAVNFPYKPRENYIVLTDKATFIQNYNGASNHTAYGWFFNEDGTNTEYVSQASAAGGRITYDAASKTLAYINGATNYSATVNWIYHLDPNGAYRTYQTSGPWYANTNDLIVAGGGYYSTGDNDTTYSYYSFNKDEFTTSGPYECELLITEDKVAEDIVKCEIMIDIGGEQFKPWNVIIPVTVTSTEHSDWETMFKVIPIMAIVAVIALMAAEIKSKY